MALRVAILLSNSSSEIKQFQVLLIAIKSQVDEITGFVLICQRRDQKNVTGNSMVIIAIQREEENELADGSEFKGTIGKNLFPEF